MRFSSALHEDIEPVEQTLASAILDAMPEQLCLLNSDGVVIAVNEAWVRFAQENGGAGRDGFLGANYFDICDMAYLDSAEPDNVADGLRAVLAGQREAYHHAYPCHAPTRKRWFQLSARRVEYGSAPMLLITHHDITAWMTTCLVPDPPPAPVPEGDAAMLQEALNELVEPLTSIAFDTETCYRRLAALKPSDAVASDALKHIAEQVDRAAAIIRRVRQGISRVTRK